MEARPRTAERPVGRRRTAWLAMPTRPSSKPRRPPATTSTARRGSYTALASARSWTAGVAPAGLGASWRGAASTWSASTSTRVCWTPPGVARRRYPGCWATWRTSTWAAPSTPSCWRATC